MDEPNLAYIELGKKWKSSCKILLGEIARKIGETGDLGYDIYSIGQAQPKAL